MFNTKNIPWVDAHFRLWMQQKVTKMCPTQLGMCQIFSLHRQEFVTTFHLLQLTSLVAKVVADTYKMLSYTVMIVFFGAFNSFMHVKQKILYHCKQFALLFQGSLDLGVSPELRALIASDIAPEEPRLYKGVRISYLHSTYLLFLPLITNTEDWSLSRQIQH